MLYFLQLLRFIASLLVLLFHLKLVESGYKGVDIFFVISGFVMYYTLFSLSRPRAFKFIVNRLTKIFFLYWVAVMLLYIIMPYKHEFFTLRTIFLIPGHTPVLGVSWSLSYELYFYFVIGLMAYAVPARLHVPLFIAFFIACTIITFLNLTSLSYKGSAVNFFIGQNSREFLFGILSGYCFTTERIKPVFAVGATIVAFIVFLVVSIPWNKPLSYIIYGPLAFAIVWLISAYEKGYPMSKKLTGVVKVAGEASYGIYLFGPIVTVVIVPGSTFSIIMIIVTTVVFSVLFNRFVESRFLKWSRKIIFNSPVYAKINGNTV
jgi:exopolysaccharide production protein ExoZ